MNQRLFLVIFCISALALQTRAQVVLPDRESAGGIHQHAYGLGMAFGPASGIGLSFRHHFPSTISYQLTGGIIKADDRLLYCFGAEAQVDLSRTLTTRFFLAGAVGYYHAGKGDKNEMEGPGRAGLGLGGETFMGGGFHGTIEVLFTYFSDGTVLPLPQAGFHYYF